MTHITIERTQVKQWLEALKDIDALHHPAEPESGDAMKAIADMEQALAQPSVFRDGYTNPPQRTEEETVVWRYLQLNTPQRPWVDLTDEELFKWWCVSEEADATEAEIDFADCLIIARAVLAKSKEKNT